MGFNSGFKGLNYISTTKRKATTTPEACEVPIFQNKVPHSTQQFSKIGMFIVILNTYVSTGDCGTSAIMGDCKILE